jgi:diguanylate cyclase (GGDEF)-like protein
MGKDRVPNLPPTGRLRRLRERLFHPLAPTLAAALFVLVVGAAAVYANALIAWNSEADQIAHLVRFTVPSGGPTLPDGSETMRLSRYVVVRSTLVTNDPAAGSDACAVRLAERLGALLGTSMPPEITAIVAVCQRGDAAAHVAEDIPRLVVLHPHFDPSGKHAVTEITVVEMMPRPSLVGTISEPGPAFGLSGVALAAALLAWHWGRATHRRIVDLWAAAALDGQTGMLRRETFLAWLSGAIVEARATGADLAVLAIDIDNLKAINDARGHAAGDAAIRIVAGAIADVLGKERVAGRMGGDEFVALLVGAGLSTAAAHAEAIRAAVAVAAVPVAGRAVTTTVSIGVAELAGDDDAARLVHRADAALYDAKGADRNRVVTAAP